MAYGISGLLGLRTESTWGTPSGAAPTDWIELLNESVTLGIDRFEVRNIVGGLYEPNDMAGVRRIQGDIVFPAQPVAIGHFLNGVLGINSITVVASGVLWTTKFFPNSTDAGTLNPLPAYTGWFFRDVTSASQFMGMQFSRLQLSIQPNQDVRATVGIIAKQNSVTAWTTGNAPRSSTDPFAFDTASISVGGAAIDICEAMTITIDHQLEGVPSLNNSVYIRAVRRRPPTQVRVSGTYAFEDLTEYNNFVQQTEQAFSVGLFRATSFAMNILIPKVVYTAYPLGMPGRDRLLVNFEGRANYHTGSARSIEIGLTTTKSNFA